jgi:hypothetical protein
MRLRGIKTTSTKTNNVDGSPPLATRLLFPTVRNSGPTFARCRLLAINALREAPIGQSPFAVVVSIKSLSGLEIYVMVMVQCQVHCGICLLFNNDSRLISSQTCRRVKSKKGSEPKVGIIPYLHRNRKCRTSSTGTFLIVVGSSIHFHYLSVNAICFSRRTMIVATAFCLFAGLLSLFSADAFSIAGRTSIKRTGRRSSTSILLAKPKVFIDGEAGTTGLQVRDRLASRDDIELLSAPTELRKDVATRKRLINEADAVILCT